MKPNIANRTIFCRDNLEILRGINSDCIDLIYLDPPFNKKKTFTAPIGSKAEGAAFEDIFKKEDIKDEWLFLIEYKYKDIYKLIKAVKEISRGDYNWCYLVYMAIRLIECHRVLKRTGSLYLHCDPTMSHYLKLLLDCIFGETNFRNELVWCYAGGGIPKKDFPRKHDVILRYSKTARLVFNVEYKPYGSHNINGQRATDLGGKRSRLYHPEGTPVNDWWFDVNPVINWSKERTGYPTQKPLALLERIIKASSNKGDLVLDPFCGCATTCVAAEYLERQWIGIDISAKAYQLVKDRLSNPVRLANFENGVTWKFEGKTIQRTDIPKRTDIPAKPKLSYKEIKRLLYIEQDAKCALCKTSFEERHFEIDHFYPKSLGGIDDISNRQLLCGSCNRIKGDKSMEEAIAIAKKRGLISSNT